MTEFRRLHEISALTRVTSVFAHMANGVIEHVEQYLTLQAHLIRLQRLVVPLFSGIVHVRLQWPCSYIISIKTVRVVGWFSPALSSTTSYRRCTTDGIKERVVRVVFRAIPLVLSLKMGCCDT